MSLLGNEELNSELPKVFIGEKKDKGFSIILCDDEPHHFRLIKDGKDYTPRPLRVKRYPVIPNRNISYLWKCMECESVEGKRDPDLESIASSMSVLSVIDRRDTFKSKIVSRLALSQSDKSTDGSDTGSISGLHKLDYGLDDFNLPPVKVPSLFRLREDPPPAKDEIYTFKVRFEETELINLFEYNTSYIDVELPQAKRYIYMNEILEKQKASEKISSRYFDQATQTSILLTIDNFTKMPINSRRNATVQASDSDRLQTYFRFHLMEPPEEEVKILTSLIQIEDVIKDEELSTDEEEENLEPNEVVLEPVVKILEAPEFAKGVATVERILVSNVFIDRQLFFRDRMAQDPELDKVEFAYYVKYLWTFSSTRSKGKSVTSISWSCLEPYLFAASYGQYFSNKKVHGLICIWNLKNIKFPERSMWFKSSVTYVDFSKKFPRVLAAGFYDGHCSLIDVVPRDIEVMCSSQFSEKLDMLPIWQIKWFLSDDADEFPISVGQSGKVLLYKKDHSFTPVSLLLLNRREGETQGIPHKEIEKPIFNFTPAATCFCAHPSNRQVYLVGTSDGCVYACSVHYKKQYFSVFSAHRGHVTNIIFHPLTDKLFLTSGADFYIRIWVYGLNEPVISLKFRLEPIETAIWNPAYPLIIGSISGIHFDLWDLRKSQLTPVKTIKNKRKYRNVSCSFTKDGSNILVGDMDGNILVYALYGMPFIPSDPIQLLAHAIKEHLRNEPDKLRRVIAKLGEPFIGNVHL